MIDYWTAMRFAHLAAQGSEDPSRSVGAVLAVDGAVLTRTMACNEFPRGVSRDLGYRWKRPAKYLFIEHAERNAIYRAARYGIATIGLTLVCPWGACADCARAIIQSGIATLVRETLPASGWSDSIALGDTMLAEAGVRVVTLEPAA